MNATMTDAGTILALRSKCALLEASLKKADTEARKGIMDAATQVLGCIPADVLSHMTIAEDAFDWLNEIFTVTKQLAAERTTDNYMRIEKLSALGRYIASEYANTVGCEKERIERSIKASVSC